MSYFDKLFCILICVAHINIIINIISAKEDENSFFLNYYLNRLSFWNLVLDKRKKNHNLMNQQLLT